MIGARAGGAPLFLPAPARLRRLRWRLTAVFTGASAVALLALASFAIHSDGAARSQMARQELLRRADTARALVYQNADGKIGLDGFASDPVTEGPPQLWVVTATVGPAGRILFSGQDQSLRLPAEVVLRVADDALAHPDDPVEQRRTGGERGPATQLLGEVFFDVTGQVPAGAVVVASSTAAAEQAHARLSRQLLAGVGLISVVLATVGFVMSGLSLRPAREAMARQEQFLAQVAHDLRTPVAALQTLHGAALVPGAQQADLRARADLLTSRLGRTVEDLLTRARLSTGALQAQRRPTRVDLLMEQVSAEAAASWPTASISVSAAPLVAVVDPALLARAIANLIDNAVRHHRGGRPHVVISTSPGAVTVTDDGPGLPPDARSSGGLGLAVAEAVATVHGGTMTVSGATTGGACVRLSFDVGASAG